MIQEIFLKTDYNMKFHFKEHMCKIAYPKSTYMKPHAESVKTKDTPKNVKSTLSDNSIKRSPSFFEHVDSLYLDSTISQSKKIYIMGACIKKPSLSPKQVHIIECVSI